MWNWKGIIYCEFFPCGQLFNSEFYQHWNIEFHEGNARNSGSVKEASSHNPNLIIMFSLFAKFCWLYKIGLNWDLSKYRLWWSMCDNLIEPKNWANYSGKGRCLSYKVDEKRACKKQKIGSAFLLPRLIAHFRGVINFQQEWPPWFCNVVRKGAFAQNGFEKQFNPIHPLLKPKGVSAGNQTHSWTPPVDYSGKKSFSDQVPPTLRLKCNVVAVFVLLRKYG